MNPEILDSLQRRFGSADFSRYQVVRGQKYDFVRLSSTSVPSVSFFSNPIGAADPGAGGAGLFKTLEQTNLVKSASFGQEYFALTQIRTYANFVPLDRQTGGVATIGTNAVFRTFTALANGAMEQLQNALNRGVLQVSFAQKLYYQISRPFIMCPPGFGVDVRSLASSRTGNAAETSVPRTNWRVAGDNRGESVYNVDPIQIIEPEIQIEASISFPDGGSPVLTDTALTTANATYTPSVEIGLIFDGYVIRPTQ